LINTNNNTNAEDKHKQ